MRIEILQHALGNPRTRKGIYRNHYATAPGCDNYDDVLTLVEKGYMAEANADANTGKLKLFYVTEKGKELLFGEAQK